MVDWPEAGVNLLITLFGTFVAIVVAFWADRHVRRRTDESRKREEIARLRAMRKDIAASVRENHLYLKRIHAQGSGTEARWLPVALLRFSVWEAHRTEYVRAERNAEERKGATAYFERLRTLQLLAGLGRMELERVRSTITDPLRRLQPPPTRTLGEIETALDEILREALDMAETLAVRLELEPSKWRRKKIAPQAGKNP